MTRKHLSPAVTAALGAGVLLLALGTLEAHAPDVPEVAELDGGTPEEAARADTRKAGELRVKAGPPVPVTPEAWMKKSPCNWEGAREEAIRGACFVRVAGSQPPCPRALFEHTGACFIAVARTPRPDTSIGE